MELTTERGRLVGKMFEAALKEKMNQLAQRYDYGLVLELWTRLEKVGCLKPYFCKWRWKADMTITEAMDCLDDYFAGLESLLQKRQKDGDVRQRKNRRTEGSNEKIGKGSNW